MKLVKHVPVESMTFERFDDYYYQPKYDLPSDKRVNFQTLEMFLVPEEATRMAALRSGEADIAPVSFASRK
jgi:ABC-type transport system substrate-binding protein